MLSKSKYSLQNYIQYFHNVLKRINSFKNRKQCFHVYTKLVCKNREWNDSNDMVLSEKTVIQFIQSNTDISTEHLTPEIKLHLITPKCNLWYSKEEDCLVPDPFWAFYWPGGQALTRYLLDHPWLTQGKSVLDVGSGCGASAIAASMCGATRVLANDICTVAATAIKMNTKINQTCIEITTDNYIGTDLSSKFDVVLLGDMFYDAEFTNLVAKWIEQLRNERKEIIIGDPGRISFMNHPIKKNLTMVGKYELPQQAKEENNGLTHGFVWNYK